RHVDIEHRKIGLLALERVERGGAVRSGHDEKAGLLQRKAGDREEIRIVVCEKDFHESPLPVARNPVSLLRSGASAARSTRIRSPSGSSTRTLVRASLVRPSVTRPP